MRLIKALILWLICLAPVMAQGIIVPGGSTIVLDGSTSGTVTLSAPAVAGTTSFQLPASNGTAGQFLQTDGTGITSWQTTSGGGGVSTVAGDGTAISVSPSTGSPVVSVMSNAVLPGSPTTTTQSAFDATTKIATDAFVQTAISNVLPVFSVTAYGAKSDLQTNPSADAAITASSHALSISSSLFAPADVGKVIEIEGAGVGSGPLITTISGYTNANAVSVTTAASTTVSATGIYWGTDDTTAWQNAINAACAAPYGGRIYAPAWSMIGGALQTAAPYNAQLVIPYCALTAGGSSKSLDIEGPSTPSLLGFAVLTAKAKGLSGAGLMSPLISASSGSILSSGVGTFPNVTTLVVRNFGFRGLDNPKLCAVNANNLHQLIMDSCLIDLDQDGTALVQPSNTWASAIETPAINNDGSIVLSDIRISGYYTGVALNEQSCCYVVQCSNCYQAFKLYPGYHSVHLDRVGIIHCVYGLTCPTGVAQFDADSVQIEHASSGWQIPTYDLADGNDYMHGRFGYETVLSGTGTVDTILVNGGQNVSVSSLYNGGVKIQSARNNGAVPTVVAGLAAGTSPPSPTLANANDACGTVSFGTGTLATSGALTVLTFKTAYTHGAPIVVITPANAATAALGIYISAQTNSGFTVSVVIAPSSSQSVGTYQFNFVVIG